MTTYIQIADETFVNRDMIEVVAPNEKDENENRTILILASGRTVNVDYDILPSEFIASHILGTDKDELSWNESTKLRRQN